MLGNGEHDISMFYLSHEPASYSSIVIYYYGVVKKVLSRKLNSKAQPTPEGYSCDGTALPAHWLGGKRRMASLQVTVKYGGRRQYYGGAMQLVGIGTVLLGDEALDFQEARWFFSRCWWSGSFWRVSGVPILT